jgi:hypothetical protein
VLHLLDKRTTHGSTLVWLLAIVVVVSALAPVASAQAQPGIPDGSAALVIAAAGRYDDLATALADGGLVALHSMPPTGVIVVAAPATTDAWLAEGLAARVYRSPVRQAAIASLPEAEGFAVSAWNAFVTGPTGDVSKDDDGVHDEGFVAPDRAGLSGYALDPSLYQQSEYMVGRVAVNIVLVESSGAVDPSTENWTAPERQLVFQQVVAAMSWWQSMEPRAHLQFVYDDHFTSPIPTSYEPINRPHGDERLWIAEAMKSLGYVQPSYITAVRQYNRATRNRLGTDWAFTVFVVDSSNDEDNHFADSYFAYAYVHGPFMVMTSENNGYGAENMAAVAAHETGHIFGALDEYAGASVPPTTIAGYLGVPCGNSAYGGNAGVESIMRGGITPYTQRQLDVYAAGQIGWRDSDGDGILDPVDTGVTAAATLTPADGALRLAGSAVDVPWPSPTRNPLSINTISLARYRVNGGRWYDLAATDGAFSSGSEAFGGDLPPAPVGAWQVEVLAANTGGSTGMVTLPLTISEGGAAEATTVDAVATADGENGEAMIEGAATTASGTSAVTAIEYQVDTGAWQPLAAADGAYDGPSEAFTTVLTGLSAGTHSFSVRAWTASPWVVPQVWQQGLDVVNTQSPPVTGDLYVPLVTNLR